LAPNTRSFAGYAFMAVAALLGLLVLRPSAKSPEPEPTPRAQSQRDTPRTPETAAAPAEVVLASNAAANQPAEPESPPAELRHPHPITPQHERIYRENTLTFSLDGAVDVEDVPGIRRLLASYRQEFPEDSLVLQQGYELIANCLEHPGTATRAVAQRFYDTELASPLRRHVRRHCLEQP
jgi:hypothetical protein